MRLKLSKKLSLLKICIDRQRNYLSYIQFAMIAYLFIGEVGFKLWYLLIVPLMILSIYIDMKYIQPNELGHLLKRNSEWQRFIKNAERRLDK
jgi:hypothetical protein